MGGNHIEREYNKNCIVGVPIYNMHTGSLDTNEDGRDK